MNANLERLLQLQGIDREIAELFTWIQALPQHLAEIELQLQHVTERDQTLKEKVVNNQKERKKLEGEIQMIEQRISKHKNQLLEVKTNEEYKALLHEIDYEEKQIRKFEDQILEKMVEADALDKELKEVEAELARQRANVEQEKRVAENESKKRTEKLRQMESERSTLRETIGDDLLDLYTRLHKLRDGVVLSEVKEELCSLCNMKLRPQAWNDLKKNNDIVRCDNCGRILYWNPPQVPVEG